MSVVYFLSIMALDCSTRGKSRIPQGLASPAQYAIFLDETQPEPTATRNIFAVNAAFMGSTEAFQRLLGLIPHPASEHKWAEPKNIGSSVEAIQILGKFIENGDLKLVFTYASKGDLPQAGLSPFAYSRQHDQQAKLMIAGMVLQSPDIENMNSINYCVDGPLSRVLCEQTRHKMITTANIFGKRLILSGNTDPLYVPRKLADNLAGAFALFAERMVTPDYVSESLATRKGRMLNQKRTAILEALTEILCTNMKADPSKLEAEIDRRSFLDFEGSPWGLSPVSFMRVPANDACVMRSLLSDQNLTLEAA